MLRNTFKLRFKLFMIYFKIKETAVNFSIKIMSYKISKL